MQHIQISWPTLSAAYAVRGKAKCIHAQTSNAITLLVANEHLVVDLTGRMEFKSSWPLWSSKVMVWRRAFMNLTTGTTCIGMYMIYIYIYIYAHTHTYIYIYIYPCVYIYILYIYVWCIIFCISSYQYVYLHGIWHIMSRIVEVLPACCPRMLIVILPLCPWCDISTEIATANYAWSVPKYSKVKFKQTRRLGAIRKLSRLELPRLFSERRKPKSLAIARRASCCKIFLPWHPLTSAEGPCQGQKLGMWIKKTLWKLGTPENGAPL